MKEVRSTLLPLCAALGVIQAVDACRTSKVERTPFMFILRYYKVF